MTTFMQISWLEDFIKSSTNKFNNQTPGKPGTRESRAIA
jgi:hypothetical protein